MRERSVATTYSSLEPDYKRRITGSGIVLLSPVLQQGVPIGKERYWHIAKRAAWRRGVTQRPPFRSELETRVPSFRSERPNRLVCNSFLYWRPRRLPVNR